jgi:hypothetical protein
VGALDEKLPDSTLSLIFSEELFDDLQDRKVYAHLDVRQVFEKYKAWCDVRRIKPKPDKFIGWLNREIPNRKGNGPDDDLLTRFATGSAYCNPYRRIGSKNASYELSGSEA